MTTANSLPWPNSTLSENETSSFDSLRGLKTATQLPSNTSSDTAPARDLQPLELGELEPVVGPPQYFLIGILLLSSVLLIWHIHRLPVIVVDDAFISFRYARNLVEGHGLVFNTSERVEGYSNPLWVLLMAGGMKCGIDPVALARMLGTACAVLTLLVTTVFARRLMHSSILAAAVALILACSTALCASSVNGLETALYMLLMTCGIACAATDRLASASVLLGLAAMTRPEGAVVLVVCAGLFMLVRRPKVNSLTVRHLVLPGGIILVAMLAFRLAYYGHLQANSVVAKGAMLTMLGRTPTRHWLEIIFNSQGLSYVGGFLLYTFGLVACFALVPLLRRHVERWASLLLFATVVVSMIVAVYNFGDWMTAYRLLTPYLPILTILVVWGMSLTLKAVPQRLGPGLKYCLALTMVCVVINSALRQFQRHPPEPFTNPDIELAATLSASRQPKLLAATDVLGRLGYYAANVPIIDMGGLTDAYIARHGKPSPPYGKSDFDYVLSRRPHFIMNNVRSAWARRINQTAFVDQYWWMDYPPWSSPVDHASQPRFVFVQRGSVLEAELRDKYPEAVFASPREVVRQTAD